MSKQDFFSAKPDTDTQLRIASIFETVDGETSVYPQGGWSVFIRTQSCRIGCSWCDTRYTWDPRKGQLMTPSDIIRCLSFSHIRKVTITGGEPMEQYGWPFEMLLSMLSEKHYQVSMETGGCDYLGKVLQTHPEVNFVVDYKMPAAKIMRPMVMHNFPLLRHTDVVKFVVTLDEMEELPDIVKELRGHLQHCAARMVFSPVWEQTSQLPAFMKAAKRLGFPRLEVGLNLQLHKFLFPLDYREEETPLVKSSS